MNNLKRGPSKRSWIFAHNCVVVLGLFMGLACGMAAVKGSNEFKEAKAQIEAEGYTDELGEKRDRGGDRSLVGGICSPLFLGMALTSMFGRKR